MWVNPWVSRGLLAPACTTNTIRLSPWTTTPNNAFSLAKRLRQAILAAGDHHYESPLEEITDHATLLVSLKGMAADIKEDVKAGTAKVDALEAAWKLGFQP